MPVVRSPSNQQMALNVCGSSTFGRYPKVSIEKTYNMFMSDNWLVDYAGYKIILSSTLLNNGTEGRGVFTSTKLGGLIAVFNDQVFLIKISYNQQTDEPLFDQIFNIGQLQSSSGVVYITENNRPQVLISDNIHLYIYDTTVSGTVQIVPNLNFTPGYITFHDTYFIAAASNDMTYTPPANNTWRLSLQNQGYLNTVTFTGSGTTITPTSSGSFVNGSTIQFTGTTTLTPGTIYYIGNSTGSTFQVFLSFADSESLTNPQNVDSAGSFYTTAWPDIAQNVGLLSTKPDNVQAVVRFPSKGNMILVMGSIVTESWTDTGAQLFPYQRNNQLNFDYGCIQPATVAYMDEIVVWLAQNEKSGPIIMYSDGGMPKKITTDGIDFLFSELQSPASSQGFLYRQDGHLFYHINFYADNLSLFYDFNTDKFYNASDQNMNYFIASEIAFLGNQYYFVTRNNGNLFAFDTAFTTYQDVESSISTTPKTYIIPRIRTCRNIMLPSQEYFIANDVGFTIESGETNYYEQDSSQNSSPTIFGLLDGTNFLLLDSTNFNLLSTEDGVLQEGPKVFLSVSYDGGQAFGAEWAYDLPTIGKRRNRLMWWQLGVANTITCQFRFQGIGRFVSTDGIVNIR